MSEVNGIHCPIIECVNTVTSPCETIGLRADFLKATFTETVRTKSTAVEVAFAARAGVDFLLREVGVEREEDDEYDADTNHAPSGMRRRAFTRCKVRVTRNANHKVNGVG